MTDDIVAAHNHSIEHREEIVASEVCGCFYCMSVFRPEEITEWTDDGKTAICPRCSIDSVIGSKSGYPIAPEFLRSMHKHWFK